MTRQHHTTPPAGRLPPPTPGDADKIAGRELGPPCWTCSSPATPTGLAPTPAQVGGRLPQEYQESSRYLYELASSRFGWTLDDVRGVQAHHLAGVPYGGLTP